MFSAQHRDHGDIMETGRNSKTKEELRLDLEEVLNNQNPDDDYTDLSLEILLECLDCVLVEHDEPFQQEQGKLFDAEMDC